MSDAPGTIFVCPCCQQPLPDRPAYEKAAAYAEGRETLSTADIVLNCAGCDKVMEVDDDGRITEPFAEHEEGWIVCAACAPSPDGPNINRDPT